MNVLARSRVLAVLAAVVLVAAGSPAVAAPGKPPPGAGTAQPDKSVPAGFASWDEVMTVQQRLNKAADAITAGDPDGYGGIKADPLTRELVVYWKGTVPAGVQRIIDAQTVPVRVLPAKYTQKELRAETARVIQDKSITSAGPAPDGSGL